ncbi:hypothetical protein WJX72_000534 [[Myrmecia] bisecta]|uniref:Acyl-[acyl-carrier-protein] desaturase n=1 Tax=[Myrmecia] bisecta TaxID=41462 RepID=A0AAW1PCC3_9CHLO
MAALAYSLHHQGIEAIESMSGWAETNLIPLLKPVDQSWQPSDYLPDSMTDEYEEQVAELRRSARELPDDYLVALAGDMITEEALPSYMNMLNTLEKTRDESGADPTPWARWTRAWTAEENRHGDLLNKYMYLSGRVDMRAVEVTIQNLIGSGLNPGLENNPYLCFVYTSFQERATKISHYNTARLAATHGVNSLRDVCGIIAADEARHETAYTKIVSEFFVRDPEGALAAFYDMMKKGITMPAHLMDDGWHAAHNSGRHLFADYSSVAERIGVYTAYDYADIVEHLVKKWKVDELTCLSAEGLMQQEFLCKHADRIRRLAFLHEERRKREQARGRLRTGQFSWVKQRGVAL